MDRSQILTFDFTLTESGTYRLYCTPMEGQSSEKTEFTVPEPPASPAAAPTQAEKPAAVQPQVIKSTGQKTSISGDYSCSASQQVILTIKADLSAELQVSGPGFIDHINCKPSPSTEGWYINGWSTRQTKRSALTPATVGGLTPAGRSGIRVGLYLERRPACTTKEPPLVNPPCG